MWGGANVQHNEWFTTFRGAGQGMWLEMKHKRLMTKCRLWYQQGQQCLESSVPEPLSSFCFHLLCGRSHKVTLGVTASARLALGSCSGGSYKWLWKIKTAGGRMLCTDPNVGVCFALSPRDGCDQKVLDAITSPGDRAAVQRSLVPSELRSCWKDKIDVILEGEDLRSKANKVIEFPLLIV